MNNPPEFLKEPLRDSAKKPWRFLNRDGTFNIAREGVRIPFSDLYHFLLSASWTRFFSLVIFTYLFINSFFALAYCSCGSQAIEGLQYDSSITHFMGCFFFSVQTLATIGYGRISPIGLLPNLLVTFEALVGLLSLALATGLLYARFARPTARVVFSNVAIIGNHDGVFSFLFRIANERLNQISEAHVSVIVIKSEHTQEGELFRNLYDLKLDRDYSPIFNMTWTVLHTIDEKSPLFGMSEEQMIKAELEIMISLVGVDDTFSAPIHSRFSYTTRDLIWNARFKDMLDRQTDGKIHVRLPLIHETLPLPSSQN